LDKPILLADENVHAGIVERYSWSELDNIVKALISVLSTKVIQGSFFTITPIKVRERKLP
jgi:hypothetical protein